MSLLYTRGFLWKSFLLGILISFAIYNRKVGNDDFAAEIVRELHKDVVYLNIPVEEYVLADRLASPLVPDTYDGFAWISIALDVATFEANIPLIGFVPVPMGGYQHKVNFLVRDTKNDVSGYLIANIEFENNMAGFLKSVGAVFTQGVPSQTSIYNVSKSRGEGNVETSFEWSASLCCKPASNENKFEVRASVIALSNDNVAFYEFVTNRPHKYVQDAFGNVLRSPELPTSDDLMAHNLTRYDEGLRGELINVVAKGDLVGSVFGVETSLKCPKGRCFYQSTCLFVDRENTIP